MADRKKLRNLVELIMRAALEKKTNATGSVLRGLRNMAQEEPADMQDGLHLGGRKRLGRQIAEAQQRQLFQRKLHDSSTPPEARYRQVIEGIYRGLGLDTTNPGAEPFRRKVEEQINEALNDDPNYARLTPEQKQKFIDSQGDLITEMMVRRKKKIIPWMNKIIGGIE